MKNKNILVPVNFPSRLTALLLAFFIITTPLAPVFAQAVEVPATSESQLAPTDSSQPVDAIPAPEPVTVAPESPEKQSDSKDKTDNSATNKEDKVSKDKKDTSQPIQQSSLAVSSGESSIKQTSTINLSLPTTDSVQGSMAYKFPIVIPPGRNGLQPDLALVYNSSNSEPGSPLGYGWSTNIPSIERINKTGTTNLYSENYFNSSLTGELVSLGSGSYGSKVDNGEFLTYSLSANVWTVTDKNGTTYKFGTNVAERQDDPNDTTRVYKWMLQEVRDRNDNYIKYEYAKDAGQIYPYKITYTGNGSVDGVFEVEFIKSPRSDISTNYRPAFAVTSNYSLTEINTKISGAWNRKYALAYAVGSNARKSLLDTITETGRDEAGNSVSLPATNFDYNTATHTWTDGSGTWVSPVDLRMGVIIADVNGDGLPDLLQNTGNAAGSLRNAWLNTGSGWASSTTWLPPEDLIFNSYSQGFGDDMGVRAADLNGDGRVDLIQAWSVSGYSHKRVFINNGAGWTENIGAWANFGLNEALFIEGFSSGRDAGGRVIDINGDGLPDLIKAIRNGANIHTCVQLNTGSGWAASSCGYSLSQWASPVSFINEGVIITELNGDGLPDFLRNYYQGGVTITEAYLNTGSGWILASVFNPPADMHFGEVGDSYDRGVRAVDINADGLTDLIQSSYYGRHLYINTGAGWSETTSTWDSNLQFTENNSATDGATRPVDVDGDGLTDLLKGKEDAAHNIVSTVGLNTGTSGDTMKRITYPTGGRSDITYKSSAQYMSGSTILNPNLPFVFDTVFQISNYDGIGVTSTKTYTYAGGQYYFNTYLDRKLAGFSTVTAVDSDGNKSINYFHQGNTTDSANGEYSDTASKIGKIYRTEITDNAGNMYTKLVSKWDNYDLGTGRNFVKLTRKTELDYDGDSGHKDMSEEYAYNNTNGNVIQKIEWGEVIGGNDGTFTDVGLDKFTTDYSYASNGTYNMYGLPSQETKTDQSTAKVKESKYYYDSQTFGAVVKGNLTKKEDWKSGTAYTNIQKTYNTTYGTLASDVDQRGYTTTYVNDSYNLYPVTVTNPLSQNTSYTYDYSLGKPKQITDSNSRVFQTVYDGLDRVIEEKQPDLTTPSTLVTKALYSYVDTPLAVAAQKTSYLDGTLTHIDTSYQDGLGRIIQTRSQGEGVNYAVRDFVFNSRELLDKESLPYFSFGSTKTSMTGTSALYASYTYDPLGRITNTATAVGNTSNAYNDWKITTIDANGKAKDLTKDAYGNLASVVEHNGSNYTTAYVYDNANNLTGIIDALGNIRSFTYDGLGRRLTAQDLHAPADATFGTYAYVYDDAGNQTQRVDPKNQTVNWTYDALNRPLTEDYTGGSGTEVSYTYDFGTDGIGRLTQAFALNSATTTYAYNPLGKTKQEIKTIAGTAYATSYDYDRQGNQTLVTYPDLAQARYTYNQANLLDKVEQKENGGIFTNIISNFDYAPTGQPTTIAYANGVNTTNTYDANALYRMTNKVAVEPNTKHAQDLAYIYDPISNITRITDTSDTATKKTSDYTYDNLSRLLSATITNATTTPNYTQNFTYDALGNMTNGPAGTYSYAGTNYANPHATTQTVITTSGSGSTTFTPTLDTTTNNISTGYNAGPITKTWTHTVTGTNPLIVLSADLWQYVAGAGTVSSVKWNGGLFTKATTSRSGGMQSELWYLIATTTGAKKMSVTITGATSARKLSATSFTNINQTSPLDTVKTTTGTSSDFVNPSITLTTTEASDLVISTLSRYFTTDATTTRTSLYKNRVTSTLAAASYQLATTTGNYTDTYTGAAWRDWSMAAASFKPFVSGSSTTTTTTTNTYDQNGNLAQSGTTTYSWDYQNRLTQSNNGTTSTSAYDHTGARVKLTEGATTTYFPNTLYNITGATTTKHIFGNGQFVATIEKGSVTTVRYVHTDNLSGSNVITDASGNLAETLDYYPYGQTRVDTKVGNYAGEKRKFIGQEYDAQSGLSFLNARYYNGGRGQFISQDPTHLAIGDPGKLQAITGYTQNQVLSDPQLLNSYAYAKDNPIRYSDPQGNIVPLAVPLALFAIGGILNAGETYYGDLMQNRAEGSNSYAPKSSAGEYAVSSIGGGISTAFLGGRMIGAGAVAGVTSLGQDFFGDRPLNFGKAGISAVVTPLTGGIFKGLAGASPFERAAQQGLSTVSQRTLNQGLKYETVQGTFQSSLGIVAQGNQSKNTQTQNTNSNGILSSLSRAVSAITSVISGLWKR